MDVVKAGKISIPIIKGDTGEKGDTPIRGIDYWTENDKQEIIEQVENSYNENHEEKMQELTNNAEQSLNSIILEGKNQKNELEKLAATKKEELELINNTLVPEIDNLKNSKADKTELERVEEIAKGRATGYVFNTKADMDNWLSNSENISKLVLGDNLYIKATDVPDYWWDGEQAQQLETQKVDLTEYALKTELPTKTSELENDSNYVKITDYATNEKGGVIKPSNYYSVGVTNEGLLYVDNVTNEVYKTKDDFSFISKGTLEAVLNARIGSIEDVLDTIEEKNY